MAGALHIVWGHPVKGRRVSVQVFVANPNKTEEITELLQHNKDKLLRYLGDFHTDKGVLRDPARPTHYQSEREPLCRSSDLLCTFLEAMAVSF